MFYCLSLTMCISLTVILFFSAVAYKDGKKMAANTGLSTYRNPDGSQALIQQATITTAHGLSNICLNL